jgi:hypothetical protein
MHSPVAPVYPELRRASCRHFSLSAPSEQKAFLDQRLKTKKPNVKVWMQSKNNQSENISGKLQSDSQAGS